MSCPPPSPPPPTKRKNRTNSRSCYSRSYVCMYVYARLTHLDKAISSCADINLQLVNEKQPARVSCDSTAENRPKFCNFSA